MFTRSRKAFTLLELIVVIVILGILALLAIPTFQAVINRAKDSNVENAAASLGREIAALAAFDSLAANTNTTTKYLDQGVADLAGTDITVDDAAWPVSVELERDGRCAVLTLGTSVGNSGSADVVDC